MSVQRVLRTVSPELFDEAVRTVEALLFASAEPVARESLMERIPREVDIDDVLQTIADFYAGKGRQPGEGWRKVGVPHGRRSRDVAGARAGGAEEALARRDGDAGDPRLPSAGHPRGDRIDPRRLDL